MFKAEKARELTKRNIYKIIKTYERRIKEVCKNGGNHIRVYNDEDIGDIFLIQDILKENGYTVEIIRSKASNTIYNVLISWE